MIPKELEIKILSGFHNDETTFNLLDKKGEIKAGEYHPLMKKVHLDNAKMLEPILLKYGFSGSCQAVNEAMFIIVQHAINDPVFMKKALVIMHNTPNIDPAYPAYLEDRLNFYARKPQRYGTQYTYTKAGKFTVWWLADSREMVNQRRKHVGLVPMNENEKRFDFTPLSKEEALIAYNNQNAWLIETKWCTKQDILNYEKEKQGCI